LADWGASARELDVYAAKRTGAKALVVAGELGISPRTAETHLRNLYRRAGVHTFIELEAKLREALVKGARRATRS
jgi:DNA-binding CsgD family transcriptional regulator